MVEVHPDPDSALSDAEQQLNFDQFRAMMAQVGPLHDLVRQQPHDPALAPAPAVPVATGAGPAAD